MPKAAVRERPILFTGPMVRAILDGRKTQTRRPVKLPKWSTREWDDFEIDACSGDATVICKGTGCIADLACPYGNPGDRLWVRETGWEPEEPSLRQLRDGADTWPKYAYDADGISEFEIEDFKRWKWKRRPSIFMPRWASRITLELTDVRVEELHEISAEDVLAEGVTFPARERLLAIAPIAPISDLAFLQLAYCGVWTGIHGKGAWKKNPVVWVLSFKRVDAALVASTNPPSPTAGLPATSTEQAIGTSQKEKS